MIPALLYRVSRPIVLAGLAVTMAGCTASSPTAPDGAAAKSGSTSSLNYTGTWSGTYETGSCRHSQQIAEADICGQLGSARPYILSIVQDGQFVTVSLTLGAIKFPSTTVKIRADGSVGMSAATAWNDYQVGAELILMLSSGEPVGTIKEFWTSWLLSGKATVSGRFGTVPPTAQSAP